MRELYELDLASRNPPIYRITEKSSISNVEVLYSGTVEERRRKIWEPLDEEEEDN